MVSLGHTERDSMPEIANALCWSIPNPGTAKQPELSASIYKGWGQQSGSSRQAEAILW